MPAFRVGKPRVRLTTEGTIDIGPEFVDFVAWDHAVYQDPVLWSSSDPVHYPITKTGLWLITCCYMAQINDMGTQRTCDLYVTANDFSVVLDQVRLITVDGLFNPRTALQVEMEAGDTVEIFVILPDVTPWVWNELADGSHLEVVRIGPERWT